MITSLKINKNTKLFTVIGTSTFISYNNSIKDKIMDAISAYSEHNNYCNIVSKIQMNQSIDNCINENKDIYKNSNNFIKIILIIIVLFLLIGSIIIVKKVKSKQLNK